METGATSYSFEHRSTPHPPRSLLSFLFLCVMTVLMLLSRANHKHYPHHHHQQRAREHSLNAFQTHFFASGGGT
jgi:heme exporter protein D